MSKLSTKARNKLADAAFALPSKRAYPVNDPRHAANAKSRATQQFEKGNLTASQKAQIDRKANAVLKKGKK